MKQTRDIEGLTKVSQDTSDLERRINAIKALVELNDPIGMQKLKPILKETNPELRQIVVESLAKVTVSNNALISFQ